MVTVHDVNNVTFQKAVRGYRAEEVDSFLDRIAEQLQENENEIQALRKSGDELKGNLYLLAQKIEAYRADEDNLKSALINAQRMGENVIREAKQKSDGILRDAANKADAIVLDAQEEYAAQSIELQRVKAEVGQFKADVLSLYKRHIESLSTLPEDEVEELEPEPEEMEAPEESAPAPVVEVAAVPQTQTEELPVEPSATEFAPAPAASVEEFEDGLAQEPATEEPKTLVSSFWEKDEGDLKEATATLEKEESGVFQGFKGVKFSD